MPLKLKKCREGIEFAVTVQPRASKNEVCGLYDDKLKIRLTSPPVEGAANSLCVKFLAKRLGTSPSKISIVRGLTARQKTIRVEGMDEASLLKKLLPAGEKGKNR